MKLRDLWTMHGSGRVETLDGPTGDLFIFGVTDDSRDVRFGFLFCALAGTKESGVTFCPQAAAKGAQAIAVQQDTPDDALGLSPYERSKIVVLRVPDVRAFYAGVVATFHPGRPGTIAAVTGTNGKTSTVSFVRDIWGQSGRRSISLGTLGLRSRDHVHTNLEATLTTFDAKTLHIMLGQLEREHGFSHLAMEASSHALDQQRLAALSFDAAGFTNLTQDHLDYHGTMERYFQAKAKLFREHVKAGGSAVVNVHSSWGRQIATVAAASGQKVITYGESHDSADLRLLKRSPHAQGQTLSMTLFSTSYEVEAPVAGIFQAENILCAIGLAAGTGVPIQTAVDAISNLSPVPGRLERVASLSNGATIYVDYAHTPDALDNVLRSLQPHVCAGAALHVLFGCGGDRDSTKRPMMGRIATEHANQVWVTDDNPRSEDPDAIRRNILEGAPGATDAGPRHEALQRAIEALQPADVLLVAGKGHEDYQIVRELDALSVPIRDAQNRIKTYKMPFSDPQMIQTIVQRLAS